MYRFIPKLLATVVFITCCLIAGQVRANHIFGADFNYTWVSGNTYTLRLTIYGDCAGAFTSGSSFNGLNGATPLIYIYKNSALIDSVNLLQQGVGVEVTPVCPLQANFTKCSVPGSTIQGVKRYIYSKNYTLNGLSPNWLFQFDGNLPGVSNNYIAGRSTSIGNITPPTAGSITRLEATLNNTVGINSNPAYTTIPTPFFCINKPANYNPGTVDANGDLLSFALIDGLEGNPPNGVGGTVSYPFPYSGANPLSTVTGTFVFNNTNGQLDFTPNLINNFLIVSKVTETRGGIVVGTSMREMVFVIVACTNNPPAGIISNPSGGATASGGNTINICKETGLLSFKINPTDVDGDVINVAANGLPTGATFTVAGNNTIAPNGTFSWNVSTVTPGTYTFFITYTDQGCPLASKQTTAYTVNVLPNPSLSFTLVSAATCLKKAVFILNPAAGTNPNTITFGSITRSGVNGAITDSLSPGTYTFTITGSNGCTHDTSITIASPVNIGIAAVVKRSTCNTLGDGSVTLTATNGTLPYTYANGGGAYTAANTFSPLTAGSYTFHVKDANGCVKDTTIAIADSLIISGTATVSDVLCYLGNTGSISIAGNGGTNPYTYALGAGSFGAGNTFGTLTAGSYIIHVRDNSGCTGDVAASVTQPTLLTATGVATNITCFGANDGKITVTGSGGTPGYTYALGSSAGPYGSGNVFTGLAPSPSYVVYVKDANGCIASDDKGITQPAVLRFTFAVTNVLCNGGSTGTVTITATGGTPAYTYAADAGAFGAASLLTGLAAGMHAIHLKDANGCIKDSTITITQPAVLGVTAGAAINPTCNGGANGSITIAGNGGTTPYTYAIGAGAFGASGAFTGLAAGTYALHVKDANACTKDTSITLGEPTAITVSAFIVRPRCTPLVNGSVTLTAGGGTPSYTYARGPGSYGASPTFTNLGSGTYTFHIKDNKACIKDTTITVTDSIFVHADLTITAAKCFNEASGSIAIVPRGGDAPYVFALGSGAFSAATPIVNVLVGPYVLVVKDANGCRLDTAITVTQPTIIVPSVTITQPKCFADSNGILIAGASGGTPGYTFALGATPFVASGLFDSLKAGTYTIHLKDNNGCLHDTTVTMGQPTLLTISLPVISHNLCFGDNSGFVKVIAGGGTPSYTYNADALAYAVSTTVGGLAAGAHVIHVQDANACIASASITLNQPPKVNVLITKIVTPTCEGFTDGRVEIAAGSGTPGVNPAYTYSGDNTTFNARQAYGSLAEGPHTFYVKDFNGCVGDTTVTLVGYPHIVIEGVIITPPSCHGDTNASFVLNVTGGNQPLTYVLLRPRDTSVTGTFDSLLKGSYAIHISDTSRCFKDTTIRIDEPDSLLVSTIVTKNDCNGVDDGGGVKAVVMGGTMPYSYLWSNNIASTSETITGMPNGKYMVRVTDAHNCKDSATATVTYDNCCKPFIPDAFTPNADGRNDEFRVRWKGDIKLLDFSVYNRFGQRLFYTTETSKGWDGTWNDKPQDLGTYFYYIKMICGNGGDNVLEFKGDVTLIR